MPWLRNDQRPGEIKIAQHQIDANEKLSLRNDARKQKLSMVARVVQVVAYGLVVSAVAGLALATLPRFQRERPTFLGRFAYCFWR
jgi:hypothetical protein